MYVPPGTYVYTYVRKSSQPNNHRGAMIARHGSNCPTSKCTSECVRECEGRFTHGVAEMVPRVECLHFWAMHRVSREHRRRFRAGLVCPRVLSTAVCLLWIDASYALHLYLFMLSAVGDDAYKSHQHRRIVSSNKKTAARRVRNTHPQPIFKYRLLDHATAAAAAAAAVTAVFVLHSSKRVGAEKGRLSALLACWHHVSRRDRK